MKKKIYYHDTDCGGVVYYANYLKYLEEARSEFLAEQGVLMKELINSGTLFVVSRQEIDYKFPAQYGDVLDISTHISNLGAARIDYEHEIKNQRDEVIVKAKTTLVCVDKNLKPKSIPEEVRKRLS
jgi:acyl-CoA thioester hydrolase